MLYGRFFRSIEVIFTLAMVAILLLLSTAFGLPILLPRGNSAAFVGVHYLYPLLGLGVWGLFALVGQKRQLARIFLVALPCYAIVLVVHFNIKLWVPHINPANFDAAYWATDQLLRPLVDVCMALRKQMAPILPIDSNVYMIGFIAMFYVSFCYHAVWTPQWFRKLFLAALFFQGLGALAYLPFPALGAFVFETGVNPAVTAAQDGMLAFHNEIIAHAPSWLAEHGPARITAGLGAMPSLHAGAAFLFFLFAWRHGPVLAPLYAVILAFIVIAAVATRWHYLIDVLVGLALGWVSIWLAGRFVPAAETEATIPAPAGRPALGTDDGPAS
jgi:membrane-associated phospholipid phosphatase